MSAIISPCGSYRYTLHRKLSDNAEVALFIMLNPSTADAQLDDPTIRRCMGFAAREGCGSLTVVNLYAFRATNPKALLTAPNPIGPDNDRHIQEQLQRTREVGGIVVAAWGAFPMAVERARAVVKQFGPFQCLGVTKAGAPSHPLYLNGNAALRPYFALVP